MTYTLERPSNQEQVTPAFDSAEAIRESAELDRLREYRIEHQLSKALGTAQRYVDTARLKPALLPSLDTTALAEHNSSVIDISLALASDRLFLKQLAIYTGKEEDALIDTVCKLAEGDTMEAAVGDGFAVEFNGLGRNRAGFRTIVNSEVPVEARQSAVTDFETALSHAYPELNDALDQVQERIQHGDWEAYSDSTFRFEENADEIAHFLQMRLAQPRRFQAEIIEALYALPAHYPGEEFASEADPSGIYFDEQGAIQKVLLKTAFSGLFLALRSADPTQRGDLSEIPVHIGMELDPECAYAELGHSGSLQERQRPFIDSRPAAALVGGFEQAGLQLNERLRDIITESGSIEKRYGLAYASMTRELAKLVNDRERPLTEFFVSEEQDISSRVAELEDTDIPGASEVISILKGVVYRQPDSQDMKTLPVSHQRIESRDGSCADAEVYIAAGNMHDTAETEPALWRSSHGRPAVMTMEPVVFNDVELPAGALFAAEPDGYVFMRLTSFGFSGEDAREIFGAQELQNSQHSNLETLRHLTNT